MKKRLALILAVAMLLSLTPAAFAEDDGDSLKVQTRTGEYTFHVGDTFTYSYWLRLTPDLVNYSEDYIRGYIKQIAGNSDIIGNNYWLKNANLSKLNLESLTRMNLKSCGGNIMYDTKCLTPISYSMPNVNQHSALGVKKGGYIYQKGDLLDGSIIDGSVLDFTNGDMAFWTGKVNNAEDQKVFQDNKVLITVTFRVTQGSDTPVYIRTRLRHLEVTTNGFLGLTKSTDIVLVHRDQSVFIPYESYETVEYEGHHESPSIVLKSLVDDVGLDIRFLNTKGEEDKYRRPDAGVNVNMYGFTTDSRYICVNSKTDGSRVQWFYDVPYGQYYVNCSYKDGNGTFFATPDPEKAEHINVPATGEVQALWLCYTDAEQTQQIDMYFNWVGDNGYLPARPDYLLADLVTTTSIEGELSTFQHERIIGRDQEHDSFDCVKYTDRDGNALDYKLNVTMLNTSASPAAYTVAIDEKTGDDGSPDYYITLTYVGDKSALNAVEPDEFGHYWSEDMQRTVKPSCTVEGRRYSVCLICHSTKYEILPKTEHSWDTGVVSKAPTENSSGTMTYTCTVCGAKKSEDIPALGHTHSYTAYVTVPTCTEHGYTTHTCACGDSYVDSYVPALGHRFVGGVCERCGAKDPDYSVQIRNPFTDVSENSVYCPGIIWAYDKGITNGATTTTFNPNDPCTRAQVVAFLWRAAGSPEPAASVKNPFTDVKDGTYYYKAVMWAVAEGITRGVTDDSFAPNDTVTRAQFVTFLYRYEKSPAIAADMANPFTDLRAGSFCYDAVLWAADKGVTNGVTSTTFCPNDPCTRAQVVTFIYRDMT